MAMKSGDRKPPRNETVIDHSKILRVIRSIPRGVVAAYGEIAERAGYRGRARLIGRVLRESPATDLPWHRVLRADGRIAFPPGSKSYREQVRRLAAEGILVVRGRVKLDAHGWDRNLDAALWAPPPGGGARPKRGKRGA